MFLNLANPNYNQVGFSKLVKNVSRWWL